MLVKKFASSFLLLDIDNASLMNVLRNKISIKEYVRDTLFLKIKINKTNTNIFSYKIIMLHQ